MKRIYREELTVLSNWVDHRQELRLSTLFTLLQDASLQHATELGVGKERTLDRGLLWVVTRHHAEVVRMPRYNERIVLETWPGNTRRMLFPRYYRILDEQGAVLLKIATLWVIIDANTRKLVVPELYHLAVPGVETGDEISVNAPPHVLDVSEHTELTVPYSYIDINGHMNNVRYFDVCLDAAYEQIGNRPIRELRVEYNNEAKFGEVLHVDWGTQDNELYFAGTVTDRPCFKIGLTLAPN